MEFQIKENYISCGCNKTPHAADWGPNGKICFGTSESVGIFNPYPSVNESSTKCQIECLLNVHRGAVTSVRWVRNSLGRPVNALISTSADKTLVLTSRSLNFAYLKEAVASGHENTVTVADGIVSCIDAEYKPESTTIVIASASADFTVRLWTRGEETGCLHCTDCLSFGTGFALDLRLAIIGGSYLLACASDDFKVHLFSSNGSSGKYAKAHVLTGHEDWVRAMDFVWKGNKLLLATGSQDTFVRVYELTIKKKGVLDSSAKVNLPAFVETEEVEFPVGGTTVGVRLDTVLLGHEGWVYGVAFHCSAEDGSVKLLTSSMDKSVVVWEAQDGVWMETARVGEVGGNTLGFYGGKFSPDGQSVMAHGYQGSFHIWKCTKEDSWEPQVVSGGHVGHVADLSWAPSGRYLLSVGVDQTTRLHAPWKTNQKSIWHEIARPQVHGHDMSCIATLTDTSFVSGAEEKVVRAFRAPTNFLDNFRRICLMEVSDIPQTEAPEGASVPALGLSNKPVFHDVSNGESVKDPDLYFSPLHLEQPPTEENLLQNTLWPEVQKLYGHGYEVHCIASNPKGTAVASACHASNLEHASVLIWDTRTWTQIQRLAFHRLTVTQMAFSSDDRYLVTVSRDRRWCLYKRDDSSGLLVAHVNGEKTPHTRIIWCCAWSQDGNVFGTGSRDGVICLWNPSSGICLAQINAGDSVTALAFSKSPDLQSSILLAGCDSGHIILFTWTEEALIKKQEFQCHASTVSRIQFRPDNGSEFASCSKDFSVKIFEISQVQAKEPEA